MDVMNKRIKTIENAPLIGNMDDDNAVSNATDRISDLPGELLCHILSFLPTRDAIATSILSTKWRYLFPLIPNLRLNLHDTFPSSPQNVSIISLINFMNFMDRLLNVTLRDVPSICSFSLSCKEIKYGKRMADWVGAALRLNVERLELRVRVLMSPKYLVDKLYGCKLSSLILSLEAVQDTSDYKFSLPNLRMLRVEQTKFVIVNNLLLGCPVLESLVLLECSGELEENLCIKVPSLKELGIFNGIANLWGALELDCPSLEHFSYIGFLDNQYLLNKLKSLKDARLEVYPNMCQLSFEAEEQATEIVKACCDGQNLNLSKFFITALNKLPSLPRFPNLVSLDVFRMDLEGLKLMLKLIRCAPKLSFVTVKEGLSRRTSARNFVLRNSIVINLRQCPDNTFVLTIQRGVGVAMASTLSAPTGA